MRVKEEEEEGEGRGGLGGRKKRQGGRGPFSYSIPFVWLGVGARAVRCYSRTNVPHPTSASPLRVEGRKSTGLRIR